MLCYCFFLSQCKRRKKREGRRKLRLRLGGEPSSKNCDFHGNDNDEDVKGAHLNQRWRQKKVQTFYRFFVNLNLLFLFLFSFLFPQPHPSPPPPPPQQFFCFHFSFYQFPYSFFLFFFCWYFLKIFIIFQFLLQNFSRFIKYFFHFVSFSSPSPSSSTFFLLSSLSLSLKSFYTSAFSKGTQKEVSRNETSRALKPENPSEYKKEKEKGKVIKYRFLCLNKKILPFSGRRYPPIFFYR